MYVRDSHIWYPCKNDFISTYNFENALSYVIITQITKIGLRR